MNTKTTVMLVEDLIGYRETLEIALSQVGDMDLIAQFGTAEIALRYLEDSANPSPDILLLDLNLPGMSGLEAIRWVREYAPETEIIILTQSDKATEVDRALREGASGYLLKSATLKEIIEGIQVVRQGGATLDPEVARYLLNALQRQPSPNPTGKSLSERELEILELLGEGLVKKEIADRLSIGITTVAYHVKHIYEKLDVANAPAAISKAYKQGILSPEDKKTNLS